MLEPEPSRGYCYNRWHTVTVADLQRRDEIFFNLLWPYFVLVLGSGVSSELMDLDWAHVQA
jgi:hypothetical protein